MAGIAGLGVGVGGTEHNLSAGRAASTAPAARTVVQVAARIAARDGRELGVDLDRPVRARGRRVHVRGGSGRARPGSFSTCPVSTATTRSPAAIVPARTSCRTPATLAALAGSQPVPLASITAFASMISASLTAATTPCVSRIAVTARAIRRGVADLDRRRDRPRLHPVALGEAARGSSARTAPRPPPARRAAAAPSRSARARAPRGAPSRRRRCCRGCPPGARSSPGASHAELRERLEDDRLLPLDAPRVHRVEQVDAEPLARLAHQSQAVVEVAAHEQRARAVRDRLRELAERDAVRGHEHERRESRRSPRTPPSRRRCCRWSRRRRRGAPMRFACVTAAVMPRSLNEPVGFIPSCLSQRRVAPVHAVTARALEERRVPLGEADGASPRVGHDELAVAPDAGALARREARARARAPRTSRRRVHDVEQTAAGGQTTCGSARARLPRALEAALDGRSRGGGHAGRIGARGAARESRETSRRAMGVLSVHPDPAHTAALASFVTLRRSGLPLHASPPPPCPPGPAKSPSPSRSPCRCSRADSSSAPAARGTRRGSSTRCSTTSARATWIRSPAGDLYEKAARGLVREIQDPYAALYSPKELTEFTASTGGRYGGLGMLVEDQQGVTVVSRVFPHTPAEAGGVREGDRIIMVGEQSTRGWRLDAGDGPAEGDARDGGEGHLRAPGRAAADPDAVHARGDPRAGGAVRDASSATRPATSRSSSSTRRRPQELTDAVARLQQRRGAVARDRPARQRRRDRGPGDRRSASSSSSPGSRSRACAGATARRSGTSSRGPADGAVDPAGGAHRRLHGERERDRRRRAAGPRPRARSSGRRASARDSCSRSIRSTAAGRSSSPPRSGTRRAAAPSRRSASSWTASSSRNRTPSESDTAKKARPIFHSDDGRVVYGGGAISPDVIGAPRHAHRRRAALPEGGDAEVAGVLRHAVQFLDVEEGQRASGLHDRRRRGGARSTRSSAAPA